MAYGAVSCLELIIERLMKSSHISIVPNSSPQIINHLYEEILSFKAALEEFDARRSSLNLKMVKSLEAEMIDAVYQFEDVLEPLLSNQFHSQFEEHEAEETSDDDDHPPLMLLSVDVQEIKQDVDSFIETLKKMKRAYIHELYNPSPKEEEDDTVGSTTDIGGNDHSSNMVGLSNLFTRIKDRLMLPRSELMITSLVGMAGIGKTTVAKKLFQDPSIVSRFSTCVFVTVGPEYRPEDVLLDILRVVDADLIETMNMEGEQVQPVLMKLLLFIVLTNRSYLIVLDDVWDHELNYGFFPDSNNGSRILMTCRMRVSTDSSIFEIPFLDKKESWDLLHEKVFGDEPCSYWFEKAGRKIAKNCEGLPLTIVTVAKIISEADKKTLEYWNEVAADEQHSVYKDAYDQMSKVLYPSYDYLQQHLKACFLYLGAFPQNYSIYPNSLIKYLWSAEGFLSPTMTHDDSENGYFRPLYSKSLIIQFLNNTDSNKFRLHTSFWYLCCKEAAKTKLFYSLNCCDDAFPEEGIKYHRRLCIRNSVLFAIREAHDSIAFASRVRSLLCTGSDSEYPVPLCLEHLRLLRVFDARSLRFYEFPMEVVKLIQLRYIFLVCDGNLPTSISKLLNLQLLIVEKRLRIVESAGNLSSYLPVKIWNMTELICLRTTGRDLPHPFEGSLLPNLLQLAGVSPQSCTKDVLEKIPHLKELGIEIELAPDATEPLTCFDHISHVHQLDFLHCEIVNPTLKPTFVTQLTPLSDFPSNLSSIFLSGLGYPWEEMRKISSLPNLEHLILTCYAFRGPKWEVHDNEFKKLQLLTIEDTDLEHWKFVITSSYQPVISNIHISHCYKLKEIPLAFGESLIEIRVSECSPVAVNCFRELKQVWDAQYGDHERSLSLTVHSSLK